MTTVATNRKAFHEYAIEEQFEAGIVLVGSEVKSLRDNGCSLQEAYARPSDGEMYLVGMRISPYRQATVDIPDPDRTRKLLLHRQEIARMMSLCTQKGYTLIPLKVYFKGGWAKVRLGLARRKNKGDKRHQLIEQQSIKEARMHLKKFAAR